MYYFFHSPYTYLASPYHTYLPPRITWKRLEAYLWLSPDSNSNFSGSVHAERDLIKATHVFHHWIMTFLSAPPFWPSFLLSPFYQREGGGVWEHPSGCALLQIAYGPVLLNCLACTDKRGSPPAPTVIHPPAETSNHKGLHLEASLPAFEHWMEKGLLRRSCQSSSVAPLEFRELQSNYKTAVMENW